MEIQKIGFNEIELLKPLQPEGWPNMLPKFEFYTTSHFCFPIKLIMDSQIVGIGTTIIYEDSAWLAHIIVHPDFRNKGLGKIITEKLIEQAKEKSCKTINLIATELGSFVYEKLGFITDTEYLFYKVPKNEKKYYNNKFIFPFNISFEHEILEMDQKVSKENRSKLLKEHLKNAFVYLHNKKVTGYYIPTLGEGLLVATNKIAATELLKFRRNTKENIVFPVNNLIAKEFMRQSKYDIVYKAKRMRIGEERVVAFSNIYSRIGGNLG